MEENYLLLVSLFVIATLCWMVGVVKVLLALVLLGAVVSLASDPSKTDPHGLLWSTLLLVSRDSSSSSSSNEMLHRRSYNPELDADPVGLIQHWGYPAERHWVTTEDGYILGIHRIPGRQQGCRPGGAPRPAAILAHPLLSSSAEWLVLGPGKSLAFLLADEGYDVWLFNARGNTHSKNHTTLSPQDKDFWDFTFHEHALYDMPATIEYVVRETGQQKVQYVGFSMGTTLMFIMASLRPDMASRLQLFTALGPAADLRNSRSATFRVLASSSKLLKRGAELLGVRQFLPSSAAFKWAGENFCSDGTWTQSLCSSLISSLSGKNDAQMNKTMLPMIISRTPGGTSFKTIDHYAQCVKSGFTFYDYGTRGNMKRYGRASPPLYDMRNVKVPVRLHYGMNDMLTDWKDVQSLCATLPNALSCEAVSDPLWTHLDFVWAYDAPRLVYRKVIADMNESNNLVT